MSALDKPWQFKSGGPPGPGRPIGQRNILSTNVLRALNADFQQHGVRVIEDVRLREPAVYLKIVASLCPRQLNVEHTSQLGELSDEELDAVGEMLKASRAKLVQQIERVTLVVEDEPLEVQQLIAEELEQPKT